MTSTDRTVTAFVGRNADGARVFVRMSLETRESTAYVLTGMLGSPVLLARLWRQGLWCSAQALPHRHNTRCH